MEKIRWGVLGTAKIGAQKVIPAMQLGQYSKIYAIASRNIDKSQQLANQLDIAKAYGSYEELLYDSNVDAVYIPLPNHLHVPWSIKAIEAGKHVLCEKPIGISSVESKKLLMKAKSFPELKVMEAFMYRHHPQWKIAKKLIAEGQIGSLKTVQSFFSYFNVDPNNIRNKADIGGGGMFDIGSYCLSLARFLFDREPIRICGLLDYDPNFKTDRLASGILDFGDSLSTFICSTQLVPYQRVNIFGTEGRIEIEIPFNAPLNKVSHIWHQRGGKTKKIRLDAHNQYTIQGDLFSLAVLNDTEVPTPLEDAVANMTLLEAMFRSAESRTWVDL